MSRVFLVNAWKNAKCVIDTERLHAEEIEDIVRGAKEQWKN